MKQLIDKDALVAEIEKIIEEPAPSHDQQCPWEDGYYCGLYKAESIIDTFETKEVDLEKELKFLDNTLFDLDGVAVQGATHYITVEDVKYIAKHFYELGLTQKGE
jgi:hypothetical protein